MLHTVNIKIKFPIIIIFKSKTWNNKVDFMFKIGKHTVSSIRFFYLVFNSRMFNATEV
jgi:hypothetical protein